jgi:site-specific recombinase XerC
MGHSTYDPVGDHHAWNAGRKLGAKRALKPQQIWAIRFMLDREKRVRDRALFDLAIDSKLRGCDLVKIRIGDLVSGGRVRNRAIVIQQRTKRPVQFELLEPARGSLLAWLERRGGLWTRSRFQAASLARTT